MTPWCCILKVEVFDLGGSKNIRRIWKTYLAEVHGVSRVSWPDWLHELRLNLDGI